ncbi:uncharacterized protein [Fopius arisanus]|uniref:Glycosyltransferase family 92 protein n=1 Tax=Fopius arisanus TaxID=64838 RepID=A0A0C9RWP3_9HYME|nr:PREDICTED: uncharacterized protein LOC105268261 [Fopius arisanus]XP_011305968.1 PREDICTED: uncharacterized protein LOC105268261 [Fopius arisanus]XP_011305976.1 PREDICTED: uncharacterized protein LOC105268261 [Fopius arisanus]XP_011305986.1 PREDICTED: uncharacterized protein LOC105268261 [Fopius arisanus]XP_011305997.1 PREDICTED: uncharacterized protein LOC105268261 [Fopius arisanus]XP_011306006.1 PREDICTED: uncharacterized protein LOC105268261 [Fopius arisanus]XP_011306016.1 PREDICTED: unc
MRQSFLSGGSRCARRGLVFVFIWGLVMIGALQFRRVENEVLQEHDSPTMDEVYPTPGVWEHSLKQAPPSPLTSVHRDTPGIGELSVYNSEKRTPVDVDGYSPSIDTYKRLKKLTDKRQPMLDKRPPKTDDEIVNEIEKRLPSLPLAYWMKSSAIKPPNQAKSSGCVAKFPSIFDLEFNNIYWQTLKTSNGTFQLFGAYYDNRKLSRIGPAIRLVGMIDRIDPKVKTYCQLWYDGERDAKIVDVFEYKYIWYSKWGNYKQGIYQPYVIACKVPQSHWRKGPPASVSIVERACDTATNNLRVIYNRPQVKKEFAVCVKGLDFLHEDLSVRLIEWIELIGILGADKIYFYQLQVHPNVTKVLDYYQKLGRIEVTPLTLPGGQPNVPAFQHMYLTKRTNHKRQNELIPYNDCLYKHMYEYDYIALLDIDEVIMPAQDTTWNQLMRRVLPKALGIRNETRASYNVRNVYFLDDLLHSHETFDHVPRYMHMLQHVYRSKNYTKPNQYVKCFHNPERVVTLHNHFPLACLGSGCTTYAIDTEDAQLQHYRADCVKSLKKTCVQYRENSVLDTKIWRYKDELVDRVTRTLETLGFFGPG